MKALEFKKYRSGLDPRAYIIEVYAYECIMGLGKAAYVPKPAGSVQTFLYLVPDR